jgi:hypothetical protein
MLISILIIIFYIVRRDSFSTLDIRGPHLSGSKVTTKGSLTSE